ncbi:hypothetical protein QU877_07515, partial [Escherichia coli]
MSRINKQLNASNSNIYTPVFVESILKVNIPVSIYLKSADHFDDKYISSTSDSWVFDYSGSRCYAHFRQDKISNQLIKYICFHYASAKCLKWFTEFGHLNRGDMLTSEQHRCHNE